MKQILSLLAILLLANSSFCFNINVQTEEDTFDGCDGQKNTEELLDLQWQILAESPHGTLYQIKDGQNFIKLLNLTGTPYQMGRAYGDLLEDQVLAPLKAMQDYLTESFVDDFSDFPKILRPQLAQAKFEAMYALLGLNYEVALPYIPERYIQEMQGIADSNAGVTFEQISRMNMFPELIKAHCTILGAWKESTVDNHLLTLRALDWEPEAPVSKFPLITVYHSTEKGSYPFANIGYNSLIGSITAVGSQGVSIQEKVHLVHGDVPPIPSTYAGKPWNFVMRDLAQFALTMDDMAETISATNRTCPIYMGFASRESNDFELIDYQLEDLQFYTDSNFTIAYAPNHPQLNGVTYVDKKVQPSSNACVGSIVQSYYGSIDWEVLYREVCGFHRTGDGQICVTDVNRNVIWLSYADPTTNTNAYQRSPLFIDLNPFFGTNMN